MTTRIRGHRSVNHRTHHADRPPIRANGWSPGVTWRPEDSCSQVRLSFGHSIGHFRSVPWSRTSALPILRTDVTRNVTLERHPRQFPWSGQAGSASPWLCWTSRWHRPLSPWPHGRSQLLRERAEWRAPPRAVPPGEAHPYRSQESGLLGGHAIHVGSRQRARLLVGAARLVVRKVGTAAGQAVGGRNRLLTNEQQRKGWAGGHRGEHAWDGRPSWLPPADGYGWLRRSSRLCSARPRPASSWRR